MKKVTEVTANDLDNLEFELQREAEKENKKSHYVNNKELYQEFVKYQPAKQKWVDSGKEGNPPPLTDKIGQAIMDIAHRRCYSPRFVNYAPNWKEEMISDAIETCVKYAHNFDPDKYNNPFAYLTQLVTNAIFQRIKKEHKQQYIKMKLFDEYHGFAGDLDENNMNSEDIETLNETNEMYHDRLEYIDNYESLQGLKKKRAKRKKKGSGDSILDME